MMSVVARRVLLLASLLLLSLPAMLFAQTPPASGATGTIQGDVTAQGRAIYLGGAQVLVFSGSTRVANVLTEGDGSFKVEGLRPGVYRVTALLDGFQPMAANVTIEAGRTVTLPLDLELAETVIVRGDQPTSVIATTGTLAAGDAVRTEEVDQISPGSGLQGALKLLVSVIEVPGGIAIKGGRPNQAGMQLGPGMFVDPATGLTQGTLPDDAIDSITVLPNPYAVEFGRFSSGLVIVQTRRGADKWRMRFNSLDPSFRTERGAPLHIMGLQSFYPRAEIGGPLIKDKLFIQHAVQYKYRANDVPSRPQNELRTSHRFSSFTRMDAALSPRHSLVALGGVFPSRARFATLGTFTPPDATVDLRNRVDTVAVTERSLLTETLFLESTAEVNRYHARVRPQGTAPMEVLPERTEGNFFNVQERTTSTYQVVETLTGTRQTRGGLHQYKTGVDILYNRFDGHSSSAPVLIRRSSDHSLARRLDFSPGGAQQIDSTDFAVFAQDRWQPSSRWYLEFGGRVDRDGVIGQLNATPRIGSAILLTPSGSAVIRGGFGLFYERTPSAAGVFEKYETMTDTRYAADGVTPLAPGELFRHVRGRLETPRSATWDIVYDHKLSSRWSIRLGAIDRRGSRELIVQPVLVPGASELRLQSTGRSKYREIETGVHFTGGPGVDFNVSYVRSEARADLNAFTSYFDTILSPVLGQNDYGPAQADSPHRLLARGRAMPFQNWLFVGVLDWRSGLPYSIVGESFDFIGQRNTERFPNYFRLDLGIEHRFTFGKLRPWIGVRADNALNSYLPSDVQSNNSSPAFRTFYNTEYRQFRIQVRFEK